MIMSIIDVNGGQTALDLELENIHHAGGHKHNHACDGDRKVHNAEKVK
jgi:hypothetical protein